MIHIDNKYNVNLEGVKLIGSGRIILGKKCEIRYGSIIEMNNGILEIGERSVIGYLSFIQLTGEMNIGRGSLLGPHNTYITSSHAQSTINKIIDLPLIRGKINIGNNVWIGANCTINYNVDINDNSIVGANSFVNKRVEKNTVVGGTPAIVLLGVK